MKESTKTLYEAVAKAIGMEEGVAPARYEQEFLDRIEANRYNDFLSESPTPITDLIGDLTELGLHDLAERARAGEFDGTLPEAHAYLMSDEADGTLAALGIDAAWARKNAKPRATKPAPSYRVETDPLSFRESA